MKKAVFGLAVLLSLWMCAMYAYAEHTVFFQTDSRWKAVPYGYRDTNVQAYIGQGGDGDLGAGCGLLALTNAVYELNGTFLNPADLASWSLSHGYRINGVGTANNFAQKYVEAYGDTIHVKYDGSQSTINSTVSNHIKNGGVAIISVVGHFACLVDYDSSTGKYLALDSAPTQSRLDAGTGMVWLTASQLASHAKWKVSGVYLFSNTQAPKPPHPVLVVTSGDSMNAAILSWNATENTDFYSIRFYDTSGNLLYLRDDYYKTAFSALLPAGSYQAEVCSVKRDYWASESNRVNFTVTEGAVTHTPRLVSSKRQGDKLFKLYASEGTWLEYRELAAREGGRLAIVNNQTKQDGVFSLVKDYNSITYLGAQGYTNYKWKWVDGTDVEGFTAWDANKPDNWEGLENCLVMYPSNGAWEDYPCADDYANAYVAEFDAVRLTVEPIEEYWNDGVDGIRDNLNVVITYAEGTSISRIDDYELSASEDDDNITVTVRCAGLTASCTVAKKSALKLEPDFILPASLTTLQDEAFAGCGFTFVSIPEGLTGISDRAFANCEKLKYIIIPSSVEYISKTAFSGVTGLTIYGASGSYAEAFAKAYSYTFVAN